MPDGAIQRLHKFEGMFSPETVEGAVHDSYRRLAERATVTTYLALFAEHSCASGFRLWRGARV